MSKYNITRRPRRRGSNYGWTILGPELITNGTFDSDVSDWTEGSGTATLSWNAGALKITCGAGAGAADRSAYQQITLEDGASYQLQGTRVGAGQQGSLMVRSAADGGGSLLGGAVNNLPTVGTQISTTFVMSGTTAYVTVGANNVETNFVEVDNISLKKING